MSNCLEKYANVFVWEFVWAGKERSHFLYMLLHAFYTVFEEEAISKENERM